MGTKREFRGLDARVGVVGVVLAEEFPFFSFYIFFAKKTIHDSNFVWYGLVSVNFDLYDNDINRYP